MVLHRPVLRIGSAAVLVLASLAAWSGDANLDKRQAEASQALEEGRWADAERAFRLAREADPERPSLAMGQAVALARLGRTEAALAALGDAARLGYATPAEPRGDDAFERLRSDPRFRAALETMEKSLAADRRRVAEADKPLPSADAPSFASLAELRQALDRSEVVFEPPSDWTSSEIKSRTRRMRKIAALERYVAEHPDAADRPEAALEALRAWRERAGFSLNWSRDLANDLGAQAEAFQAAYGSRAEPAREARFYAMAARACAASPEEETDFFFGPPSAGGCGGALEPLQAMAAEPDSGPWGARAATLHAICLDVTGRATPEAIRAAKARWASAGLPEGKQHQSVRLLDGALQRSLVAASLRALGAPSFTLPSSEGEPISLHGLRGKVVLVSFWSPG